MPSIVQPVALTFGGAVLTLDGAVLTDGYVSVDAEAVVRPPRVLGTNRRPRSKDYVMKRQWQWGN